MSILDTIWHGFSNAFLMAWAVWWALVLGFAISAVVQAWVPRERVERALGGGGLRPIALATGLGAASSSCSYAAIAIAKSLFQKGASAASALAFQFASTNLVVELGVVIWVLLAALAVDGLFSVAGLIPQTRPSRSDIFGSVALNYKLFTNLIGLAVFAALFALTMRRGTTDPVCGMRVDRAKAVRVERVGRISYFCSERCAHEFAAHTTERPPA